MSDFSGEQRGPFLPNNYLEEACSSNTLSEESCPLLLRPKTTIPDIETDYPILLQIIDIRTLFSFAWPVSAGYLLQLSINLSSYIDFIKINQCFLIGTHWDTILGGKVYQLLFNYQSALATMFANVTGFSFIIGMATALDTLCRYTGNPDPHSLGKHLQRSWIIMFALCIPIAFIWLNTSSILLFFGQDQELALLAQEYTMYLLPILPPYFFAETTKRYLQAQGIMNAGFIILTIAFPINVFLQYLLVWNPYFSLGFKGAPIATCLTFYIIAFSYLIHVKFISGSDSWGGFSRKEMFKTSQLWKQVKLGLPGVAMLCSEWWAYEIIALAAGWLGQDILAAQTIMLSTCSLAYRIPLGVSIATANRIGNALGAMHPNTALLRSRSGLILGVSIASINVVFLLCIRNDWGYIFTSDQKVVNIVASTIPIISLFQISDALASVGGGVLRGIGLPELGAYINFIGFYLIGLPLGFFFTFPPSNLFPPMGLMGMWWGITIAVLLISFVQMRMISKIDWVMQAVKAMQRCLSTGSMYFEESLIPHSDVFVVPSENIIE